MLQCGFEKGGLNGLTQNYRQTQTNKGIKEELEEGTSHKTEGLSG